MAALFDGRDPFAGEAVERGASRRAGFQKTTSVEQQGDEARWLAGEPFPAGRLFIWPGAPRVVFWFTDGHCSRVPESRGPGAAGSGQAAAEVGRRQALAAAAAAALLACPRAPPAWSSRFAAASQSRPASCHSEALLNDVNPHVINFYQLAQEGPVDRLRDGRTTSAATTAPRERLQRAAGDRQGQTEEAAGLFYYLNRTGYNGLCRFNSKGGFNVPFGTLQDHQLQDGLRRYSDGVRAAGCSRAWTSSSSSSSPPTSSTPTRPTTSQFTQYSKGGFGWDEQERAAEWLSKHTGSGGAVQPGHAAHREAVPQPEVRPAVPRTRRAASAAPATARRRAKSSLSAISDEPAADTRTGGVLEDMVLPALRARRLRVQNPGRTSASASASASTTSTASRRRTAGASWSRVKWQQVAGTAEQKVPFEVICLLDALDENPGKYAKAYIVLGGEGWKLRGFYTSGGLISYISYADRLDILTLEGFVARANQGKL